MKRDGPQATGEGPDHSPSPSFFCHNWNAKENDFSSEFNRER